MPINPVHFADQICHEFLRYIFSAFPLTDPALADQARNMFMRESILDMPLIRGPYVSLSEAFAEGESVQTMADNGRMHPLMPSLIGYPTMWKHQQEVFESVRKGRHVLVSTGTGSGKTEAFLYPIVDELLRERDEGVREGVKAVLIYPMNALANDQLDRLREMLAGTGIAYGLWTGTTPGKESEAKHVDRFGGSSREAFLRERKARKEDAGTDGLGIKPLAPPEECCSEEEIRNRKPRILLTNYRQLEILMTRKPDVTLFADAPLRYLVFDEAHTYEGAAGAEVSCLIRRARALAGKTSDDVICVGTSATLADPDPNAEDGEAAAKRFASRFFGVKQDMVDLVGETYVRPSWPKKRNKPLPPAGDGMDRLNRLLKAMEGEPGVDDIRRVVRELTGSDIAVGGDWREALHAHLTTNEYAYRCAHLLNKPMPLDDAAWRISNQVAPHRLEQGPRATAELLCYLALGAMAQRDGQPLLRPKVHFFIRGLDEMVMGFEEEAGEAKPILFMSIRDAREHYPDRKPDAFFPVLSCRNCGQHFVEKHYENLEIKTDSRKRPKGFNGGDAVDDGAGRVNAVWAPSTPESGTRHVLTNRLLEEAEEENESARKDRHPAIWVCAQCGSLHRDRSDRCLADGCGARGALVPLKYIGEILSSCPSCGTPKIKIGGRSIEPARAVRAVTVADVHILAQAMISVAPKDHQKLVIFADSRQDAAFQAGWMQDHARRIRMRHMMYQIIRNKGGRLPLNHITDELQKNFRADNNLVETLLPELVGVEAQARFGSDLRVSLYKTLRYMTLHEFTTGVRRRDCLESMGLARCEYEGLSPKHPSVAEWGAFLGIDAKQAAETIGLILDLWRRDRLLYVESDPIYSRYHAKDDEYIQAGLLSIVNAPPKALTLESGGHKNLKGLVSKRGVTQAMGLIRKAASDSQTIDIQMAIKWLWRILTEELALLCQVSLRNQRDRTLCTGWQIDAAKVYVIASDNLHKCKMCQRVATRQLPSRDCPAHHCKGKTEQDSSNENDYDVNLMHREFTMVSPEEHTAQVPGERREFIENQFKSRHGRVNCLVATPTLEMGVNIGALDMILLRNVPPKASNYWQRAGRAGRQERMAVIVTYCRRSMHDRFFFEDPLRLIEGKIEAPAFNLNNPLMVAKHIRSAILAQLLLDSERGGGSAEDVKNLLSESFPIFIRDYLLDENNEFRNEPPALSSLKVYLEEHQQELVSRLKGLFGQDWPEEVAGIVNEERFADIVSKTPDELRSVLRRLHNRLIWARDTRADLHRKKDKGVIEKEDEQLLRRCDQYINGVIKRDRSTYSLTVLGNEGFLPGYGIYEGGVTASAQRGFARRPGQFVFDLSRNAAVALREFVPGNRLYANRGSFYVARYHIQAGDAGNVETMVIGGDHLYVGGLDTKASYGQGGTTQIDSIPISDLDLAHEGRITENENLRFSMPVTILGHLQSHHRGGKVYKIGDSELHHLRGQGLRLVNIGESARVRKHEYGYYICPVCGGAKTHYAVDAEINKFLEIHKERCGVVPEPLALTAQTDVDMLMLLDVKNEERGYNIGEAIRTAAGQMLDMGENDLEMLLIRRADETIDLIVFDPMPGGSGLLEQLLERWRGLVDEARQILANCADQCEEACYSCLKTFRNQFYHEYLNRHRAMEFMEELDAAPQHDRDTPPVYEKSGKDDGDPSNAGEAMLARILRDHHFPPGKLRERVKTTIGMETIPDWCYIGASENSAKVAVYLDGMSRNLHGNPKQAQMDQLLRQGLELDGFKVIVIQSRDLADPEAMRHHLKAIAKALGREDLCGG